MDHLKYPVGRFSPQSGPLSFAQRSEHIASIEHHPANLRSAVRGLSDDQLDTPYRDGGWTVRQVVHHVMDSHLNSYVRFKLALTQDRPTIVPYDQDAWAALEDGRSGPVEISLSGLEGLHDRWTRLLRSLTEGQFGRELVHPEIGPISLDFMLELYGWHCRHHEGHVTQLRDRMGW